MGPAHGGDTRGTSQCGNSPCSVLSHPAPHASLPQPCCCSRSCLCTRDREHGTRCHGHGRRVRSHGETAPVQPSTGAGGLAELETHSPAGARSKHPGPQQESPQCQAGPAWALRVSLVSRLRAWHGKHRWPCRQCPAAGGLCSGRCSRAGLGRRGMQEEVVVALQHRWPLPQQHQLCAGTHGTGEGCAGVSPGLVLIPACCSKRPLAWQHLDQVGMK